MNSRDTSHRERIEFVQLKHQGFTLHQIAQQKGVNFYTVRHWWRKYRDGGWNALTPRPRQRPKRGSLSSFDPLIPYVILRLKREHPHWGPDLILLKLQQRPSLMGKPLPSRSSIAAYLSPYLKHFRKQRKPTSVKQPSQHHVYPRSVHECWQIDFKGDESVGTVGKVAPFMVVDALSSAPLQTIIYPAVTKNRTMRDVQQSLRMAFAEWGCPDFIQMDRGSIFVGSSRLEWPRTLLLWLVALGIQPIINDPRCPTQNARVERQNRTWADHVAVGVDYSTLLAVQNATDQARYERLYLLPSRNRACHGFPPLVACPQLTVPRRTFDPEQELQLFDFERVALYLADWQWFRKVDKSGKISLADTNISIGKQYAMQVVKVSYDLDDMLLVASLTDEPDMPIHRFTFPSITPEYIMGLDLPPQPSGG